MPQIPEGVHRPNHHQLIMDMLEAVALEEMATAHLLNAQGEKMQAIVHQFNHCKIDQQAMENGCMAVQNMLNTLIMNQWLLFNKMNMAIQFQTTCDPLPDPYEICKQRE
ncbi:MAG: hypothetical protein R3Y62_04050 [Eubacteriales bacterium]